MGYFVELSNVNFLIPQDKLQESFDIMCAMNTDPVYHEIKRGGSFSAQGEHARWFSWMDENYHEIASDANDILQMLGFETSYDENGNLAIIHYDSKSGQEIYFIDAIAHLVADGSHMVWTGEDSYQYRWEVVNSELTLFEPVSVWENKGKPVILPGREDKNGNNSSRRGGNSTTEALDTGNAAHSTYQSTVSNALMNSIISAEM